MFQSDDFDSIIAGECFDRFDKEIESEPLSVKTLISLEDENMTVAKLNNSQPNENKEFPIKRSLHNILSTIKDDSVDTPNRSKRKRKFPGPAGLLPENVNSKIENEPLSQPSQTLLSNSVFDEGPWLAMLSEVKLLGNNNIANVKRQALQHQLIGRKVPILAGVVQNVDRTLSNPLLVLRDQTGEIQCTLHKDAWEYLACYLVPHYSVIVLKNSTVLTTGTAMKKIYLSITNKNIMSVYCDEENIYSANPNILKTKADISKFYSEDIVIKGVTKIVVVRCRIADKSTLFLKNENTSSFNQSLATTLDGDNSLDDIIAQTLLDDITDEFISQDFE